MDNTDKKDIERLLVKAASAEASEMVWSRFEKVLRQMDPDRVELLREFFNGTSLEKLSEKKGISKKQVSEWLRTTKAELLQRLRQETRFLN